LILPQKATRCKRTPQIHDHLGWARPKYQLGRAAAELLLDEADRPVQHEHRQFVFKPELVARASSGAHPAATPGSPAFPE
jgi:hypothetical protein